MLGAGGYAIPNSSGQKRVEATQRLVPTTVQAAAVIQAKPLAAHQHVTGVPPAHLTARRLTPRPHAVAPGTIASSFALFTNRVFASARVGFALADDGSTQYPVLSTDGRRTWRIDGPQVHIDAADGAAGVGYVGAAGRRTFFTYGSSVVDVTTNAGRAWWETYLGELVTAVGQAPDSNALIAYVEQPRDNRTMASWLYVSRDGGRHWDYSATGDL